MLIVNRCSKPPLGLERHVRRSLRWIDQSHLAGLDSIRIESEMPERPDPAARETEWAKQIRGEGNSACVNGWYAERTATDSPYIMLYAQPIYRPIPSFLWWSTVPILRVVITLAHEVAHHLAASRGFIFQDGEDLTDEESVADSYAESVVKKTTAHWSYRMGQRGLKEISEWHYSSALVDCRQKKYKQAAQRFYDAWSLNPGNKEAAEWYWRAKEMSRIESK